MAGLSDCLCRALVDAVERATEKLHHHRFKKLQRERVIIWIKGWAVIFVDKLFGIGKPLMPAKLLPHVAVKTQMMEEILPLENAVILHNPKEFFRNERL